MKAIVTTTINEPTEAIYRFKSMPDWKLYVVGDKKTPDTYKDLEGVKYLSPEYQEEHYKEISDIIGWNCIQRRNIGFIEAYREGAEIIATVDDDNIPYDNWGNDVLVGKTVEIDCYENSNGIFDPMSLTNVPHLWHRGYPVGKLSTRCHNSFRGKIKTKIYVQADLWDGDPDIDAMCRITNSAPVVKISGEFPFTCLGKTIFNSQNTFIHRSVMPYYSVPPHIGRMDDIWGGIILQDFVTSMQCPLFKGFPFIAFNRPSVYQKRNVHNFVRDLENEIIGLNFTEDILTNWRMALPERSKEFLEAYMETMLEAQ